MIKIISIPDKFQQVCPHCSCIFQYEESDISDVETITCPHCGNKLPHKDSQPIYMIDEHKKDFA